MIQVSSNYVFYLISAQYHGVSYKNYLNGVNMFRFVFQFKYEITYSELSFLINSISVLLMSGLKSCLEYVSST